MVDERVQRWLTAPTAWRSIATDLSEATLRALMAGEIPAIRLRKFAATDECRRLCDAIRGAGGVGRPATTSPMNLIGCNFSNHTGEKAEYFAEGDTSYLQVGQLTAAAACDPLQRVLERLRAVWPRRVDIATEPGFGRYFAGGIKTRTEGSHLHYDFAHHTAPDYGIGAVVDQLGWNLYLELPTNTGHTIIYNYRVPRDGGAMGRGNAKGLGLDRLLIEGAEPLTFRPDVGDVVVINTRNPHEIIIDHLPAGEWRAQTSSFIGRLPDDGLVLWS